MINGQIWLKLSYDTACVLTSPDITQVIALADDTALASGDSTDVIADMLISHGSVVFTVGNLTLRISCDTTCVIDLFLLDCFFDLIGIDRKLTAVRIFYSLIRSVNVAVIFTLFYRSVIIAGDSTGLYSVVSIGPAPSIGWPIAFTTRPIIASPTGTLTTFPVRLTVCPSLIP